MVHVLNDSFDPKTDLNERAQAAVKAFRSMQHSLSSYARAITGNKKVRVEVAQGPPSTDGTTIYYRPPLALGDKTPHYRFICGQREPSGLQSCPACRVREEVLVNIYHEISHIAFDSFKPTTNQAQHAALNAAIKEVGGKYEEQLRKKFAAAPFKVKNSHIGLANLVSPYLGSLVNALDDARIDSAMFAKRKGTRKMLVADTFNLLRNGLTNAKGEIQTWQDMPLNSQISMGCYLDIAGYTGWREFLHEKVGQDISDEQLQKLLKNVHGARSIADIYSLAFPVLARLRELGYYKLPEEEEDGQGDEGSSGTAEGSLSEDSPDSSSEPVPGSEDDAPEGDASSDEDSHKGDSSSGTDESSSEDGDESEASDSPEAGEGMEQEGAPGADGELPDESSTDQSSGESTDSAGESEDQDGSSPGDRTLSSESVEDASDRQEGLNNGSDQDDVPEDSDGTESGSDGESGPQSDREGGNQGGQAESTGGQANGSSDPSDQDSGDRSSEDMEGSMDEGDRNDSSDGDSGSYDWDQPSDGQPDYDDGNQGDGSESNQIPLSGTPDDSMEPDESNQVDGPREGSGPEDDGLEGESSGPVDSGADEGLGGAEVTEVLPSYGTPEDVKDISDEVKVTEAENKALDIAIIQGTYFEWPSMGVSDVQEFRYDLSNPGWINRFEYDSYMSERAGYDCEIDIPESIMQPALIKTRKIFDENKLAGYDRNRRSGRVDARVLGRRAWKGDDDRLFGKKRNPTRKDYAVKISIDISTSNMGTNIALVKRAAFAQAELCARVGIQFSITAHSAVGSVLSDYGYTMNLHHIKDWNEPWDEKRKDALRKLTCVGGNVDGHALEFMRKELEKVDATDKILLYYTDGKFPAANKQEEEQVLLHQLKLCKRDQITLLGVGIRTDSPRRFGLDTVQVDGDEDLPRVVEHLGKRLLRSAR